MSIRPFHFVLFAIIGLLACAGNVNAQGSTQVRIIVADDSNFIKNNKVFQLKENYDNELKADKALQGLILKLYGAGYVTASLDSEVNTKGHKTAYLFVGKQYEWLDLRPSNVGVEMLNQVGFKEKQYRNKYFKYNETEQLLRDLLSYCENNGYPFAVVKLDSVKIEDNMVSANLNVTRNQLMMYDTLAIHGNVNIKKSYLYAYLGIRPGKLYNEADVQKIKKRINDLPFIQEEKPLQIIFNKNKATINLYLANKRASQFDFLLGFLPNSQSTGGFLFTGDVNLNLVNSFGLGQIIGLTWKKLQPGTQDLKILFDYPFVASLPLGADANFHLYKRDSSYLDLDYQIGLKYQFAGNSYIRAFVHNTLTNLLNVDTNAIINTRQLPANNDIRTNLFGVEYFMNRLNYRFNPQSGYTLLLTAAVGSRKVKINNTIANLADPDNVGSTFKSLYDTVRLSSIEYRINYAVEKYWPIGKRSTIRTATQGAAILGNKDLFQNELYRIGGSKLLRGFDEESIYASLYNVATIEYRYILQKNSYFNVFVDGAYVEDRIKGVYRNDYPIGFGVGFSYETKVGVLGISYALGNQKDSPVSFKSGKIHFGYVNYF